VPSEFGKGGVTSRLKGLFLILFDPYFRLVTSAYCFRVLLGVSARAGLANGSAGGATCLPLTVS
jgi:hypothetical protein